MRKKRNEQPRPRDPLAKLLRLSFREVGNFTLVEEVRQLATAGELPVFGVPFLDEPLNPPVPVIDPGVGDEEVVRSATRTAHSTLFYGYGAYMSHRHSKNEL
jgi:hypothetical protein